MGLPADTLFLHLWKLPPGEALTGWSQEELTGAVNCTVQKVSSQVKSQKSQVIFSGVSLPKGELRRGVGSLRGM